MVSGSECFSVGRDCFGRLSISRPCSSVESAALVTRRSGDRPPSRAPFRSTSPIGRGDGLRIRALAVRIRRGAPDPSACLAQRKSACLTCRMSAVRSGQRAPICVRSSISRAPLRHGGGSRGRACRTHHQFPLVAQWQSNRLISDRRMFDSSREDQTQRTCAPSGEGSGFLIRRESIVGSSPTRSSNQNSRLWRNW